MILFRRRTKHFGQQEIEALENGYVSRPDHVTWRNVEERAVILNTKNGSYSVVEETAFRIWELIDKGIAVSELARIISDEYQKNERVVKRDLTEILASMKKEGIIELREEV